MTRDRDLHERMLPHYSNFFAAMSRGAEGPPVVRKGELQAIREQVEASVRAHVDTGFWQSVHPDAAPPHATWRDAERVKLGQYRRRKSAGRVEGTLVPNCKCSPRSVRRSAKRRMAGRTSSDRP